MGHVRHRKAVPFRHVAYDPLHDVRRVEQSVDVGAENPTAISDRAVQFGPAFGGNDLERLRVVRSGDPGVNLVSRA